MAHLWRSPMLHPKHHDVMIVEVDMIEEAEVEEDMMTAVAEIVTDEIDEDHDEMTDGDIDLVKTELK